MERHKNQSDKNMYANNPKMESQRNVAYIKIKKNAMDINITQMMVGKQWVKR